jgi:ribose-phosphate pyrophosphokinase
LSKQIDWLVTVDPHLHRHKTLEEIYSIPCKTLHAVALIAQWIKNNVANPLLIGPDEESLQWVGEVARLAEAPFMILKKVRFGDKDVEVSFPQIEKYFDRTPILVDDIISSGQTMIETINHLHKLKTKAAICIGVHAIFVDDAFKNLKNSGAAQIVTCDTIAHESNKISVAHLIIDAVMKF